MRKLLLILLLAALIATAVCCFVYVDRFFKAHADESGSFFILWQLYPILFLCIMAGEVGLYSGIKYFLTERNKRPARTVLSVLLLAISATCIFFALSALSERGFLYEHVQAAALIAVPLCSVPVIIGLLTAKACIKRRVGE